VVKQKSGIASLREETEERRKDRKLKEEAEIKHQALPTRL
jgi:hypothetical protein